MCRFRRAAAAAASCTAWLAAGFPAGEAGAQGFPSKPLRLVVGFPPGGNIDINGRILAPAMAEAIGQPVVVENRPGAAGNVGAESVARGAADGYTLLVGSSSLAINATLYTALAFDPVRDLQGVGLVSEVPIVVVAHPSVPAKTAADLVGLARKLAGRVTYGTAGIGSTNHMTGELFAMATGAKLLHVPFKGSGPALQDLVGGQIDLVFDQLPSSLPFVRAGKIRALGIASAGRSAVLPDVPTLAELGIQGVEASTWAMLLAQAKTPRENVTRLNAALNRALQQPAVRERFAALGAEVLESTPERAHAFFALEVARWAKVVRASGAKVE